MKIATLFLIFFLCITYSVIAQEKDSVLRYPVYIKFQSICCGVPDDLPLRNFINRFKKKNKIKSMAAYQISPMGKEGEYDLGFSLRELNAKKRNLFITGIVDLTKKMNDKGNATAELNATIHISELPKKVSINKISF